MSNSFVTLFVQLPQSRFLADLGCHFPVYLYVDPPDSEIKASIHVHHNDSKLSCQVSDTSIVPYNKLIRLEEVPSDQDCTLYIQASAPNLEPAFHRCRIRRSAQQQTTGSGFAAKTGAMVLPAGGMTIPPTICSPINGATVNQNFISYGYVNPPTDPVSVWLVDSNGQVIPGTSVTPQAPYNWAASFAGIPQGPYTLYAEDANTQSTSNISITVQ
jgi:hypothetical protein